MNILVPAKFLVKSPIPGTWLVHEPGQHPVDGVAVWLYDSIGLWCERHGQAGCNHIEAVAEAGAP